MSTIRVPLCVCCFFFNDTATTEIYTLSLHDALRISGDLERAAELAQPRPHSRESDAWPMHARCIAAAPCQALSVVRDAEQEHVVSRFDPYPHLGCAGVPVHVGQRLLNDTQNGALDLGHKVVDCVVDLRDSAQAGAPCKSVDELRESHLQPAFVEARRM